MGQLGWLWHECRSSSAAHSSVAWALALWVGAIASLYVVNGNLWALAALPLIFAARQVKLTLPRGRLGFYVLGFYVYYPAN